MTKPRPQDEIVPLGDSGMFGLLTRAGREPVNGPVLILLNSGVIPRSGPYRLHVRLGHQLAQAGIATFRFDLPGIGDAMPDSQLTRLQTVVMALDALERHTGVRSFVLGGLCIGADLAWSTALEDSRIAGMLLIDGLARTGYWYYRAWARAHFKSPLLQFPAAIAWLVLQRLRSAEVYDREWPVRGQERAQLHTLMERGVRLFALYTGGVSVYFRDARQFASTYAVATDDPRVRFEFWPDCDHIFFTESDRVRLIEAVQDWYLATFGRAVVRDERSVLA